MSNLFRCDLSKHARKGFHSACSIISAILNDGIVLPKAPVTALL
jgi:hypothetical protein